MYINRHRHAYGDNAKLHSPLIELNGKTCLTFFYHMYGKHVGLLKVYVNKTIQLFRATGAQGNKWLLGWATMSLAGNYTVRNIFIAGSWYKT